MQELIVILLPLIMQVESGGNNKAVGDNGKAIGAYQIWQPYWKDGTEYLGVNWPYSAAKDPEKAGRVVTAYLTRYGKHYEKITGKTATLEVLARIHNGGCYGWKKEATKKYWNKIKKIMD